MDTYSEPPVLIKSDVLEKTGSEVVTELEHEPGPDNATKPRQEPTVVDESEPEIREPLVEISADLSAELDMELVPPTPDVRVPVTLRSPDLYDPLQIFLQETMSQEVRLFMVRSIFDSVLIQKNTPLSATCALLKLPSFIADMLLKSIPRPPTWLRHDASVLIL